VHHTKGQGHLTTYTKNNGSRDSERTAKHIHREKLNRSDENVAILVDNCHTTSSVATRYCINDNIYDK